MNEDVERVRAALAELIKAALLSDDGKSLACREAGAAKIAALAQDPPHPSRLRIDGTWQMAVHDAEAPELTPFEGQVNLTLPRQSPFSLDELLASDFDADEAVERIRKSASTG